MSKDIKKALEHCIEWNCADCPNREELGSGETVCRGRLLPEVLEYVADLEAKLAESEKSKESYRLQNEQHHLQLLQFYSRLGVEAFGADIHEKALETLMIMKEQLAEKDEEIAYLTKQVKKFNNEAQKYFEDAYCNDFHNQDKISFAVEQLEQIINLFEPYENEEKDTILCANNGVSFLEYIDNQIAELTHQHEEKGE